MKTETELRRAFWRGLYFLATHFKKHGLKGEYGLVIREEWEDFKQCMIKSGAAEEHLAKAKLS
jgi:hypothetical protein